MDLSNISPLVTSHQTNKENYSLKWINRVTKTKNQVFFQLSTLPTHASYISKNLSYVIESMHPLQMNSFSSIFDLYLQPRDTKTSESKGTNQISREAHKKIHLKQLHAKEGTLAWYDGLDAIRYLKRFMMTYLCL
jgi:hypothetical protein